MKRHTRSGWLMLALPILAVSILSLNTTAQRPEKAPPPTTIDQPELPDLFPDRTRFAVSQSSISLYSPDIDMRLEVENRGNGAAPQSLATVVFKVNATNQSVSQPVPPISAHGSLYVRFRVPRGCFGTQGELPPGLESESAKPRCYYTSTVDPANQVQEANEANNTDSGITFLSQVEGIKNLPKVLARQTTIQVSAQTVNSQPAGKAYVAELRKGTIYEIAAGADISRIQIRTSVGRVATERGAGQAGR